MIRVLLLLALAFAPGALADDKWAQDVWLLEHGEPGTWSGALHRLAAQERFPQLASASVHRHFDLLDRDDRLALATSLRWCLGDPRCDEMLRKLTRDADGSVREKAREAVRAASSRYGGLMMLTLAEEAGSDPQRAGGGWRIGDERIQLIQHWRPARGNSGWTALDAQRSSRAGLREEATFAAFGRLAVDADEAVAAKAVERMALLADERVADFLFERATLESRPRVRHQAWIALARRGDERSFAPLVEWAREETAKRKATGERLRPLKPYEDVGYEFAVPLLPRLVAHYRIARDADSRKGAAAMIEQQRWSAIHQDPEAMAAMHSLASNGDEFLRAHARKVLDADDNRRAREEEPRRARDRWLVAGALAGILVGAAMFVLGFRLLTLKRFIAKLAVQRVRSAAPGLVALQGEARLKDEAAVAHPVTGELCVIWESLRVPFWLDDGTGRVAIDSRRATLLSEDGVVVPGERVLVVGSLEQSAQSLKVTANTAGITWFERYVDVLVRLATTALFGRNAAAMMVRDPRRAFWIWDDLDTRPFSREAETRAMTAGLLFAGGWALVFVGAVLARL